MNLASFGAPASTFLADSPLDARLRRELAADVHGNDRMERAGTTTTTVYSGLSSMQRGGYASDGYTLTPIYADGKTERRMIVTDPVDPSVIWLDGNGYTRQ